MNCCSFTLIYSTQHANCTILCVCIYPQIKHTFVLVEVQ